MPTTAGRRIGIVIMLVLLAGAGGLAVLPRGAGAVRIGGLGVLWWYAIVVAPSVAVLVAIIVLYRRSPPAKSSAPESSGT